MSNFGKISSYPNARAARAWNKTMAAEKRAKMQSAKDVFALVSSGKVFTASKKHQKLIVGMKFRIGLNDHQEIEIKAKSGPDLKALLIVPADKVDGVIERLEAGTFKFRFKLFEFKDTWTAETVRDYFGFKYRLLAEEVR